MGLTRQRGGERTRGRCCGAGPAALLGCCGKGGAGREQAGAETKTAVMLASARAGRRGEKAGRLDQQPMKEKGEGAGPEMREGERSKFLFPFS